MPHMPTAALDTLRAVIGDDTQPTYVAGAIMHARKDCSGIGPADRLSDAGSPIDLLRSSNRFVHPCLGCCPPTVAALQSLPENVFRNPSHYSPMHSREILTPRWSAHDHTTTGRCCGRDIAWQEQPLAGITSAVAEYSHEYLLQAAAEHGKPTTWSAVPLPLLHPMSHDLPELAHFHPWATVSEFARGAGVVVMHLPATLARAAAAHGASTLQAQHCTPATWQLAGQLLRQELARIPSARGHAASRVVCAAAPRLLKVAHAATH